MKISKYRPEFVLFDKINIDFNKKNHENYNYFSSGKSCIDYLCKFYKLQNKKIVIPSYICTDVIEVLRYNKCKIIFADVDVKDLNISTKSLKNILNTNHDIFAVLVASLYGNPCDIINISDICKKRNLLLINDCCQSFGAKINDIYITNFGNASFFSFSPGKNLSGFAGGYLFSNDINFKLIHKFNNNSYFILTFIIFILNRILIDKLYTFKIGFIFSFIKKKFFNNEIDYLSNLNLPNWVKNYNLKLINRQETGKFNYKNDYILSFPSNKYFKIIKSIRGENVSFRLILFFYKIEHKKNFTDYLQSKSIYYSTGYKSFSNQKIDGIRIDNLILNIPIDKNIKLRNYLSKCILEWLDVN